MNGNHTGIAIERNVFVAEEASQATILRQLLGRADSNTILRIHQPKFVNGGARRFPQNGWKPFEECKGIRELDCERDISSRYESRA